MIVAIVILCLCPVIVPAVLAAMAPREAREGLLGIGLMVGLVLALVGAMLIAGVHGL